MKVAVASYYLPSSSKIGVGWMAHRLANAIVDAGHDVTMFSPAARPVDARYEHSQVAESGRFRSFKWGLSMRRLDLSGFDVLLAQGDDHLVRRDSVPVHIRTMHGSCFDEARHAPTWRGRLRMTALGITELIAAVRTPEVVGVSKNSLRFYPWLHRVIPNGVDMSRFGTRGDSVKESDPTILFVGTFGNRKRGQLLEQVFVDYIRPRVPNAKLWMVCDDAPSSPGVEVLGRLSDEELADRYRRAWVFCLPSTYEGFGVPYIEALLSGTVVVATPNLGAREVLEEGRLGLLAKDDDLGRVLVDVLVDPGTRSSFEVLGRSVAERYDFDVIAEQYLSLMRAGGAR